QKKDVQVRIGEQQPAAIAAQSEQAESIGRRVMDAEDFAENLPNVGIRELTKGVDGFACADTRFELLADALPFVVGLRAEDGQGRERTLHGRYGLTFANRTETKTGCDRHHIRARSRRALRCGSGWLLQPSIERSYRRRSSLSWRS